VVFESPGRDRKTGQASAREFYGRIAQPLMSVFTRRWRLSINKGIRGVWIGNPVLEAFASNKALGVRARRFDANRAFSSSGYQTSHQNESFDGDQVVPAKIVRITMNGLVSV
jgi:hypothetical protein